MSKTNTTNRRDTVLSSTGSQYHATLVAVILLCILAPNSGAASESTLLIDYTISASPSPETHLVVDDDLEVKVNGETVFIDDDGYATLDGRASWKGDPITFSALPGYELEIIATNPGGGAIELSALYLHADGESVKLSDGVPNALGSDLYEFFRERFMISIPAPLISILGYSPQQIHGDKDLEAKVGWSNIPAGWSLNVSLEGSEENHTRLADGVSKTVSISEVIGGEEVFTLKVQSIGEIHSQAKVCACFYNESGEWTGIFTKTDITVLQSPGPRIPWTVIAILLLLTTFAGAFYVIKKRGGRAEPENVKYDNANHGKIEPKEPEPQPSGPIATCSIDHFTTLRTIWDPSNKDFVWDAGKPDEYGELPRIKRWIEGNNPNIYWFLLKIVNHVDQPVTEWNVTLYTEQALTITEAHIDEKRVRIVKSDFDTGTNRNICVVAIPPELGVSIPANGGRRSMYFKMDIRCEDALKMEFGVSGVVKLGKSPQVEVPIREKRFTYACKFGHSGEPWNGHIDSPLVIVSVTNSLRLIRDFEKYCNNRYAESEVLIEKLEVVHSSLKAAEPITKEEILPLVEKNIAAMRMMSGVEAQKERGIRMCEKLIELLHIATSKIGWAAAPGEDGKMLR